MSRCRCVVILSLAAVIAGLSACAGHPAAAKLFVQSQHADDVDFDRYSRYAWASHDERRDNPLFLEYPELPGLIGAAVDRRLAAKGYEKSTAGAADFLVAMNARVQDVTVISKPRYGGWSHGYDRTSPSVRGGATELDKMAEGTLILEVVDVASEGVVWRCQAAGVVTRRERLEQAVDAAVARMLEEFPPAT